MSIQIITGFTVNSSTPLDNRIVASGAAARNSIPYKYVGLRVFDTSNNRAYYYNGVTFSNEITDQVNGASGYVPVFTSQNYIGNSGIFQVNSGYEKRIGIGTNNPTGVYTYMQIGGMSLTEDPSYYPAQSLPLTIHKGGTNVIASNWYYTGVAGGNGYFNSSKGSSLVSLGNEGDLFISNRPGGPTAPVQTIYLSNDNKVGIGSNWNWYTLPTEALDVTGNIKTSGYFKGDGSLITNVSYAQRAGTASYSVTASNINVYNSQVSHPAGRLTYMMFSSTASNVNGASVSTWYNNTRTIGFAFNPDTSQLLLPQYYYSGDPFHAQDNPPLAFATGAIDGVTTGIYGGKTFIGFSIGGINTLSLYGTYSQATSPIRYNNGSSTQPSITFITDVDTGIYRSTVASVGYSSYGSYNSTYTNQIGFTINGSPKLHISGNDLYANIHNNGLNGIGNSGNVAFVPDGEAGGTGPFQYPSIASGEFWTPVLSLPTNLTALSMKGGVSWMRVGNAVSVSGQVQFTVTSASVASKFLMTLPIKSYFGAYDSNMANPLNGVGKIIGKTGGGDVAAIRSDNTNTPGHPNNVAEFLFTPSSTGIQIMCFTYQYTVGSYWD